MKYTVIIPTYNHCDDLLKPCINSIIKNTVRTPDVDVSVIIVANGCTDGTDQYINELRSQLLPFALYSIHHKDPLGYTKATNLGIGKSMQLGSDYTILMNNDVVLMDFASNNRWLNILRKPFDENSKVGMCGTSKVLDGITGAEFIIFYMAMIRTELFHTIGLLDEQFNPGYGEDIDFSIRLQRAGHLIRRVPVEGVGHTYTETFPLIHGAEKTVHDEKSNLKTVFGMTWDEIITRNEAYLREKYSKKKKYSVIIPTYNHCNDLLLPCLNSVLTNTKAYDTEIIIVANGCTDNTREVIQKYPADNIRLLWFDEPLGYTKAANEGIKASVGEYVVLLNNDTIILNDSWLRLLTEPFETELRLGITGVQLEYINGYQYLMFFCVMIKRQVFDDVGLLDEQFSPGGFEDADFCVRAASKGYRLTPVPPIDAKPASPNNMVGENVNLPATINGMVQGQFPIFHTGGGTVTRINQWTEHMESKRALFVAKHGSADDPTLPDGWFNTKNIQQIRKFAEEMPDNGTMIQLGVWLGKSVCCLADIIKRKNLKIIAVDTFAGTLNDDTQTKEFMSTSEEYFDHNIRVSELENYVTKMKMTTDEAAKLVEREIADVIFIDADHTYPFVVRDIRNWKPILKPNGIMCGHDYMLNDVYRAVHDSYRAEDINIDNEIWWISPDRPKVYDTFMFFNEFDVLEVRLNELQYVVDYFVVVEGTKTHVGAPKPLWFKENKERFAEFLPQIRYVEVNDFPEYDLEKRYDLEAHQRAAMSRGLMDCRDHDIVLVSDVDEIPKAEVVLKYNPLDGICNIEQEMYYYYLNCTMTVEWGAAKIGTFAALSKFDSLQTIRNMAHPNSIKNGGWHFSFLGGKDNIRLKIQSYVHIEYNNAAVLSDENIDAALNDGKDLFHRELPLKFVNIDNTYPKFIINHLEYYKSIGFVKIDSPTRLPDAEYDVDSLGAALKWLPEDIKDVARLVNEKVTTGEKMDLIDEFRRSRMDFISKYVPNSIVNFIVATYNRHEELKRALESIEKQTYNRIKVWVCADGADDKVKKIVEEFDQNSQYKQYNYRHLAEHEGLLGSKPRMLGIYSISPIGATCFLDDDNIIYPEYTEKLFRALRSDGNYQGGEVYLPDSNVISYCVIKHSHAPHPIPLGGHVEGKFEYSNIDTLNIMVNSFVAKQCVTKWQHIAGQRITHDFDFIAECAKYGKSKFINEILAEHCMSQNKDEVALTPTVGYQPKFYDGFLFFNEFDTLEIRLNELSGVVDKFVLVESNLTFTGKPKPYYFEENKQRFAKFMHKIIHIKLGQFNPTEPVNPWDMEHFQRNQIFEVFKECNNNDIVMLSDVDEIPSASTVKNYLPNMGVMKIEQPMFYYYLNCKTTEPWYGTRIAPWGMVKDQAASYWRMVEDLPILPKGGWHFSYLGGAENIVKKIDAFSHQEFNTPEINNVDRITEKMNEGKDLFDRDMKFEFVPIDSTFPSYINANYGAMAAQGLIKYGTGQILQPTNTALPDRATLKRINGFVHDEIFEHDLYSMKKEEIENRVVVDIGAHYGYFGVRCLELGAESVHYYEPHPKNYEVLSKLMGQHSKAHIHNFAVTDGAFPKMFMRFDDVTADIFGQENDLAVNCISLSAAIAALPISTNNMVLKLDCEGAEYEILLHAPVDVLRKFEHIYMEVHDDLNPNFKGQSKMLLGYLQNIGFKVIYQAPQFGNWYPDGSFVPFPVYTYKLERQPITPSAPRLHRVYDCFMFNDELDVLDIRLEELNSVVDYFVIVESPVTHSGKSKPLYFAENKERYAKYLHKIRHYVFTDMPNTDNAWHRESHQRDACIQGLFDAQEYDTIISGDADEIPKRELIRGYDPRMGAVGVETKYYFYYLNCERQDKGTTHLRLLPYWLLKPYSFCFFRYKDYPIIPNGGWHFSFIGDVKQVKKKIESYAHQEYNTPYFTDEARLERIINEGGDILEKGMQFKFVEINDTFPHYVINNKDYYIQHKNIKV